MNTMQSIFDLPAKKRMLNIVSEKKIYVDLNEDYCPESDKKIKYLNLNENYNPEDDDARFVLWIHFEKIAISEEKKKNEIVQFVPTNPIISTTDSDANEKRLKSFMIDTKEGKPVYVPTKSAVSLTVNEVTINDKRNRMEFQEVIDVDCENQLNSAESIKSKSQRNLTTIKRTRTKKRRLTEIESLFKLIDNYPLK